MLTPYDDGLTDTQYVFLARARHQALKESLDELWVKTVPPIVNRILQEQANGNER
jgi:hypothetical protein